MKATRKSRSDIALTQELTLAIIERLKSWKPLLTRDSNYLLLDDQKWTSKVSKCTYNSWLRRNTIPTDSADNKGLREILAEARREILESRRAELMKGGERELRTLLKLPIYYETVKKRINSKGETEGIILTKEVNPAMVKAKVDAVIFTLKRLDRISDLTTKRAVSRFSLADLRRVKDLHYGK